MSSPYKTLIIPDIHNKHEIAEDIINAERPDLTVFLGDYFDDRGDGPKEAAATARWLADSLDHDSDRIHLIGNHDLHYMSDNKNLRCSGFAEEKRDVIRSCGIKWSNLKLYYWLNSGTRGPDTRWLCTHAGFSNTLFEQHRNDTTETIHDVLARANHDLSRVHDDSVSLVFLEAGRSRGGANDVGGLVWCDYAEFEDILHTSQIFGHTRGHNVRHGISKEICSEHYCIDTILCNYIICDENDVITVKSTANMHTHAD